LGVTKVASSPSKCGQVRPGQCADKAVSFAGQLCGYRDTLIAQGLVVRETWIHFPLAAVMANVASWEP
jgi:hypothetical protein